MTPGVNTVRQRKIKHRVHEYEHDSSAESYGAEAADKLGVDKGRVFKTLVVSLADKTLAVAVLPVSSMLNLKKMAKALGAKKAVMAEPDVVERSTGYVLGGVSPLGQKKQLKTVIDITAQNSSTIYISAGRRGLEIELSPADLRTLLRANFTDIRQ